MSSRSHRFRRAARVVGGSALLTIGLVLLVLPGPGIPLLLGGLVLLQSEFHWARRARRTLALAARTMKPAGSIGRWIVHRAAYGLALLPVLTDWFDTGHWPQHPRELATEVVLGVLIFFGVHRLHRRAETFRSAAETDPLTSLANRRCFRRDLEAAVISARATNEQLVLVLVDVDHFKAINDSRGHAAGDDVLRMMANALSRSIREGRDRCYRIGGDEFAALLPNVTESQAMEILRRGLEGAEGGPDPSTSGHLSCSVGIVALSSQEEPHQLVARADERMYLAKRAHSAAPPTSTFGRLNLVLPRESCGSPRGNAPREGSLSHG